MRASHVRSRRARCVGVGARAVLGLGRLLGAMAAEDFQLFSVWVGSLRAGSSENSVADYFFSHGLSVEDVRVTANGVLDWYAHVTFLSQEERWGDN